MTDFLVFPEDKEVIEITNNDGVTVLFARTAELAIGEESEKRQLPQSRR